MLVITTIPFSFDWMFLKYADKVDSEKISESFRNWSDRIINPGVTYPWLLKRASVLLCHQNNSVSFDRFFLTLADKVDMEAFSVEFKNWPDRSVNLKSYISITAKSASVGLCHQHNSSILIESSWNLLIWWVWLNSRMSSKLGQIESLIVELRRIDWCKSLCLTLSSS